MPARSTAKASYANEKRDLILNAATEMFLQHGYNGVSMDDISSQAGVATQTVYSYFQNKEALFVAVLLSETGRVVERLLPEDFGDPADQKELAAKLVYLAEREIKTVVTPRNLRLSRLVFAELERFPQFGEALYHGGQAGEVALLQELFKRWSKLGLISIADPKAAAEQFNNMTTVRVLSRALLLGERAIPSRAARRTLAVSAVRQFLAAHRSA